MSKIENSTPSHILDTKQKFIIQTILPEKWAYQDIIISEDIRTKIRISQEELIETWMKVTDDWISWAKTIKKEIDLSNAESEFIKKLFMELDTKKEITRDMVSVYKIFVK